MHDQIKKARAGLILSNRFFATLALHLNVIEDRTCETAWTDGKDLGYNPDFIDSLTLNETKGLIAHEVLHVACNHNTRKGSRNHDLWNEACDHAINPILKDSGFDLPQGVLYDPKYRDQSAESIYSYLQQQQQQNQGQNDQQNQQQPGSQQQQQQQPGSGNNNGSNQQPGNNQQQPGSKQNKPGSFGEIRQFQGDKTAQEQKQKVQTKQAAQIAKSQGNLPGNLSRLIDDLTDPKLPWTEILARFLTEKAKNDYSWTAPNSRYLVHGLYLPRLNNQELKKTAIAIDTSGSVSQEILNDFASELQSILSTFKTEIFVIYCDYKVQKTETMTTDQDIEFSAIGGGGTDYRPVFECIEENEIDLCVYLTDGYCNRFPDQVDIDTLWIVYDRKDFDPPFGETVNY